jgi:arsenate reductase
MSAMGDYLSAGEHEHVAEAIVRLQEEFAGAFDPETVTEVMHESVAQMEARAATTEWIPLLAEKFTRSRLHAAQRLRMDHPEREPGVLFACVQNAGRSQMAEGFMRHLAGDRVAVFSGGSRPADELHPNVVASMAEIGIDISNQSPHPWTDDIIKATDVIVTMGCGDECPVFPGRTYVDWALDDPSGRTVEEIRPIRDDIEHRVRALLAELEVTPVV